jgi:hypothetical protein
MNESAVMPKQHLAEPHLGGAAHEVEDFGGGFGDGHVEQVAALLLHLAPGGAGAVHPGQENRRGLVHLRG